MQLGALVGVNGTFPLGESPVDLEKSVFKTLNVNEITQTKAAIDRNKVPDTLVSDISQSIRVKLLSNMVNYSNYEQVLLKATVKTGVRCLESTRYKIDVLAEILHAMQGDDPVLRKRFGIENENVVAIITQINLGKHFAGLAIKADPIKFEIFAENLSFRSIYQPETIELIDGIFKRFIEKTESDMPEMPINFSYELLTENSILNLLKTKSKV